MVEFPQDAQSNAIANGSSNHSVSVPAATNPDSGAVSEEESQLETCRKMAGWGADRSTPVRVNRRTESREVLEYHDRVNSTTILGELFGQSNPRRFVRISLRNTPHAGTGKSNEDENANTDFLKRRGAFDLPPKPICDKLLRLYFQQVHPYTPVLDRVAFVRGFVNGTYSSFVLQCILTSVMPFVSDDLLSDIGLSDRSSAERFFFTKAQLLYDLEDEKSQLCLLQGSLILTASHFAFVVDKDCRYWLINAVRLATQMGLHRKQIAVQLDRPTRKLFSRLFWVLYNKDILMAIAGRANVRRLNDAHWNVPELTEDDWENEESFGQLTHFLPPIPHVQKLYLVHNTRLSRICASFIEMFSLPDSIPTKTACDDWETSMHQWRRDLPLELHLEMIERLSTENIWVLVLRAMSYRLECVFYRNLRSLCNGLEANLKSGALHRQQNVMFELSSILDRIMLQDLVSCCPLSVTTCASMVVAMHIEMALKVSPPGPKKHASRMQIHSGLAYLRASSEHWGGVRMILRMLEEIMNKTGLTLSSLDHSNFDLNSMTPFAQRQNRSLNDTTDGANRTVPTFRDATGDLVFSNNPYAADSSSSQTNLNISFETTMMDQDPEAWLNELLAEDVLGMDSTLHWSELDFGAIVDPENVGNEIT